VSLQSGVLPLEGERWQSFRALPDWKVIDGRASTRRMCFPDFKKALDFVNRGRSRRRSEGIIPTFAWLGDGRCRNLSRTRSMGLTEQRFVMAAKLDRAFFEK